MDPVTRNKYLKMYLDEGISFVNTLNISNDLKLLLELTVCASTISMGTHSLDKLERWGKEHINNV